MRRKLAVDRLKIRSDTAEKGYKNLTKEVVEQKDMRIAAQQHVRNKSEAEAKEIVETHLVSVQTEAICRSDAKMEETATQTEKLRRAEDGVAVVAGVPVCVAVYTQTDSVVVDPTSSGAAAESETALHDTEKKLLDTVATRDDSVQTEVMGRLDIQTVEFATQTKAATETTTSGVERECRHEVEVQSLKREVRKEVPARRPARERCKKGGWEVPDYAFGFEPAGYKFQSGSNDRFKDDWVCKNCGTMTFGSKSKCYKCKRSKPLNAV